MGLIRPMLQEKTGANLLDKLSSKLQTHTM